MNKIHFLYKYYLELPLRREINLLATVRKVKKILNKISKQKDIPKISEGFTAKHNINIHILCSHLHLESLLLSLASFYAFSEEYAEVVIHEDGTFTNRDAAIIGKIFPWIKYVSLKDADEALRQKGFSRETIRFRHSKYRYIIKAADFHHIESKDRIFIMDTDVFLLAGMKELWSKIVGGTELLFHVDPGNPQYCYGGAKELLEEVLGRKLKIQLTPCIGTGLSVEPAWVLREEKETFERFCAKLESFLCKKSDSHCLEQGYIASILRDKKIEEYPLQDRYEVIHYNTPRAHALKKYDFEKNPENIELIHLCQWDKLGRDFQIVKKKLLTAIYKQKPCE